MSSLDIGEFVGKTFVKIHIGTASGYSADNEALIFEQADGTRYSMHHEQDCCESVCLEDVIGDLKDLLDTPILAAQESSSPSRVDAERELLTPEEQVLHKLATFGDTKSPEYREECETWTFYQLRTIKGTVTLRWYGTSNGYYSESVDLYRIDENNNQIWN